MAPDGPGRMIRSCRFWVEVEPIGVWWERKKGFKEDQWKDQVAFYIGGETWDKGVD